MLRRIIQSSTRTLVSNTKNARFTALHSQNRSMKVYTRTGDDGTSALFANGRMVRRAKNDQIFEVLGTLDELNANVGLASAFASHDPMLDDLKDIYLAIQKDLVEAGTCIAYQPGKDQHDPAYAQFNYEAKVSEVENWIDELTQPLPELKSFILQTGGRSSCVAHVTRAVCRRAEREVNRLKITEQAQEEGCSIEQVNAVSIYLNRLSDLMFTIARYVAMKQGNDDVSYSPRKPRKVEDKVEDKVDE